MQNKRFNNLVLHYGLFGKIWKSLGKLLEKPRIILEISGKFWTN